MRSDKSLILRYFLPYAVRELFPFLPFFSVLKAPCSTSVFESVVPRPSDE